MASFSGFFKSKDRSFRYYFLSKFDKFIQKSFILSPWPRFTPQSCISIERNYAIKIFKILKIRKYPTLWLDFRIATISFLYFKKIFIFDKYLTYYRQLNNSASKKYKTMSKNWWIRRGEAHDFFSKISNLYYFILMHQSQSSSSVESSSSSDSYLDATFCLKAVIESSILPAELFLSAASLLFNELRLR